MIDKIHNPNKITDTEGKNHENTSKLSILPTTFSSTLNPIINVQENERSKHEKTEEIEKLKIKLKKNQAKIDQINKDILDNKKEFSSLQEELYQNNEQLSNKFSYIYNLELKLDKLRIKEGKVQIEKEKECKNNI